MEEEKRCDEVKCLFVLVDGIGDVSVSQLGDRTPLQYADIRHLDSLAGLYHLLSVLVFCCSLYLVHLFYFILALQILC